MANVLSVNSRIRSAVSCLQKSNVYLSRFLMALAILVFFYYSSLVFWRLIYPQGFQHMAQEVSAAGQAESYSREQQSWAWFVDSSAPKVPPPPAPSKINAKLIGVIAQSGTDGGDGVALIAVKNAVAAYSVGDELSPGVTLDGVAGSFVILKRGDVRETLLMEKPDNLIKPKAGKEDAKRQAASLSAQKLKAMPPEKQSKIFEAVQIEKYQDKKHGAGLRIRPREGYESVLSMLGLNSDDVLLSINGQNASRIKIDPKNLAAMLASGPIKLRVLRGNAVTEIVVQ